MIFVIFDVNVIFYDFCHDKIMYMHMIVYLLLFIFANELLINALWRGKQGPVKQGPDLFIWVSTVSVNW